MDKFTLFINICTVSSLVLSLVTLKQTRKDKEEYKTQVERLNREIKQNAETFNERLVLLNNIGKLEMIIPKMKEKTSNCLDILTKIKVIMANFTPETIKINEIKQLIIELENEQFEGHVLSVVSRSDELLNINKRLLNIERFYLNDNKGCISDKEGIIESISKHEILLLDEMSKMEKELEAKRNEWHRY